MLVLLRFAWIFGFISTRRYDLHVRLKRFGSGAVEGSDTALGRLENALIEDRVAVILFLIGLTILAYTYLNAPGFEGLRP